MERVPDRRHQREPTSAAVEKGTAGGVTCLGRLRATFRWDCPPQAETELGSS
jgi:hypothetical protein